MWQQVALGAPGDPLAGHPKMYRGEMAPVVVPVVVPAVVPVVVPVVSSALMEQAPLCQRTTRIQMKRTSYCWPQVLVYAQHLARHRSTSSSSEVEDLVFGMQAVRTAHQEVAVHRLAGVEHSVLPRRLEQHPDGRNESLPCCSGL